MDYVIECPKHNGRFDIRDGRPLCAPVCEKLKTYPAKVEGNRILVEV
jgi:3-phenylpropionate/trans-cinnamate dioxygenase ferredoxin subunit